MTDRPTEIPRHTAAHRAEYALARTLETAVATLPESAADAVGRSVGRIVHGLGIRRSTVEGNLRLAYPSASDEWIAATTLAAYEHLGREAAAILRLSKLDHSAVIARTDVARDWGKLDEALAEKRGVLLVTGHYGNWEIAAAAVAARGVPIAAIVRRQGNRLVDARLDGLRRRLGVETITQREAPSRVPRLLRKGGVVGIVGDQDARRSGVFVPFFGRPASTHRGPALFALRLGAPVLASVARRLPGTPGRYRVAGERVETPRTGDLEADVRTLTAALAARLEAEIREAPEQYFWFHRRWKTVAPSELVAAERGISAPPQDPRDAPEEDES
ncbi:MAG TPA: lysophospholipid acyltransferase family protein [Longimicrobium sp.]|nr:lysophospholipid acyltransferase family protein [Longimicrobium sp.]